MKQEFKTYLDEIGVTGQLVDKVQAIYNYYTEFLKVEIQDIFVSEYVNSEGLRTYESLWFFNDSYCFEAKQFISNEDYDMDYYNNEIFSFNVNKRDFDIVNLNFNDNSRMNLTFYLNSVRGGSIKASKSNCKKLAEIITTFILTNLKK